MTSILAALILSIIPQDDGICRDFVDLVELSHFYNENGDLVFDQHIFMDWNALASCYDVVAWRLVRSPSQVVARDWANGGYRVFWMDGECVRSVRAREYRETWEQHDPELAAREILPKENRRELKQPKKR